ncbi:MAG: MFS transporter [Chloroflexota bacterium]
MSTAYDAKPALSLGPNYRKVWASAAASNLADGVFWVALPLIAITLTTEPALVAGVSIAARLPWLFFVLFAGAIADRVDRRSTMRNVQLSRVAVVALLAVMAASDTLSLPLLYAAALLLGIGETFYDTASMSIMPSIVPRELLSRANSRLYAVEMATNELIGPPLGGLLMAAAIPLALAGSALGYALAALGLTLVTGTFRPQRQAQHGSMLGDIREGMAFLWHTPVLRTMAIMVAGFHFADAAVFAVIVLFVVEPGPMGLDEFGYGLLMASFAVGGLAGSLLVELAERRLGRANLITLVVVAGAVVMVIPLLTAEPLPVAAGLVTLGLAVMMWNVITVSLRQRITPDHLLGRLNAAYRFFGWGAGPLGALAGGLIAQAFGIPAVFLLAVVIHLALLWFRRSLSDAAIEAAEDAVDAPAAAEAAS